MGRMLNRARRIFSFKGKQDLESEGRESGSGQLQAVCDKLVREGRDELTNAEAEALTSREIQKMVASGHINPDYTLASSTSGVGLGM